jgi:hypothetical protein
MVGIDPTFVAQRGIGSLEPNLGKQIIVFTCIDHSPLDLFLPSSLSLRVLLLTLF